MAQLLLILYLNQKQKKMSNLRRYSFGDIIKQVHDDMAIFDDFYCKPTFTFLKGELYDPEVYDLVLKPQHLKNRLKEKEQQLSNLESIQKHYEEQNKKIKDEIEELKQQINKK
jgi:hypothetical protein